MEQKCLGVQKIAHDSKQNAYGPWWAIWASWPIRIEPPNLFVRFESVVRYEEAVLHVDANAATRRTFEMRLILSHHMGAN